MDPNGRKDPLGYDIVPNPFWDIDWLHDYWSVHFGQFALALGGTGARSNLHVDMYNWTGWHALISGRKLWRFLPRESHPEDFGHITKKTFNDVMNDYITPCKESKTNNRP